MESGENRLLAAARCGDVAELVMALDANPLINIECFHEGRGFSPATYAAYYGYSDCLEVLLTRGANPNFKVPCTDDAGSTPLVWAAYMGHLPCVELLLANGAGIDIKDRHGYTPLMNAVQGNSNFPSIPVIIKLLESGCDVTTLENTGKDVFQLADSYKKPEIKELIIGVLERGKLNSAIDQEQDGCKNILSF